ncbi:hypothetical protein [Dubosiella newyorkensis]|uniref:hypothetical protein n=1 Tax=Dubosiella newyorkensis TaxID=1862672 RepID=UPI002573C805|nr:hypothetical protein [Dubosiella newyorkensis]
MKKKLLFSLLSVFFFCFSFLPIRAEESSYPYTIRIYSGKQGTIDGQEMVETIVQPGTSISDLFSLERVQLDNDKYYVKGFKESGKDNNTMAQPLPAVAKEDADFVVVYGIKGEGTQYTIQYVDQAGNALAQPQTYYGNVGDRPVVAYRYFEGYLPQAYNLVRTLSANAAENQFTFVYAPIEQPQTTTPATPAQPTTPTTPTQPTTPAAPTTPDNQTPTEEGTTPTTPQQPQDLIDLDEEDVPLAGPNSKPATNNQTKSSSIDPWMIGLIVLALIALAGGGYYFYRKKKAEDEVLKRLH